MYRNFQLVDYVVVLYFCSKVEFRVDAVIMWEWGIYVCLGRVKHNKDIVYVMEVTYNLWQATLSQNITCSGKAMKHTHIMVVSTG